jgi:hypothetical protein
LDEQRDEASLAAVDAAAKAILNVVSTGDTVVTRDELRVGSAGASCRRGD